MVGTGGIFGRDPTLKFGVKGGVDICGGEEKFAGPKLRMGSDEVFAEPLGSPCSKIMEGLVTLLLMPLIG
jgi:hypothetical protein